MIQEIIRLKWKRIIVYIFIFLNISLIGYTQENNLAKFLQDLKSKDANIRSIAARHLGEIKNIDTVEDLIAVLKDKDFSVRANACWALGEIKDKKALEPLRQILLSPDEEWVVSDEAAKSLYKIDPDYAFKCLNIYLKSRDWTCRQQAVELLGALYNSRAVEPLISALRDKEWRVIEKTVIALGKIGDERAVRPLIEILKNPYLNFDRTAKKNVIEALKNITGQDFNDNYDRWLNYWRENKNK